MFKYLKLVIIGIVIVFFQNVSAGDSTYSIIKGKVYGKIFANYHTEINNGDNATAFEIRRAYFGYAAQLSKYFDANIKLDIGSPEDLSEFSRIRRYAYFKNAFLRFNKDKLKVYFGIIDLLHFKVQEKDWKHRYIEESFNDAYNFGFSADLGAQVIYDWAPWISTDFTLMNGEGYTKLQVDNTLKGGFGLTLYPIKNFVLRGYADFSEKVEYQTTLASYIGYRLKDKLVAGAEYNWRFNESFQENHNRAGYSFFLSYYPIKRFQVFGRYDRVYSNILEGESNPWNLVKDGSSIITGVEYTPIKYVKIALDYQDWFPMAENQSNEQYIFLNVEVVF
jgi:hypothetical protein